MNKKELFMKRMAERFGDMDPNDEESCFERAGQLMDDYEQFESATKNLIDAIDGNESLMEMITQACTREDFDPVVWMVEQRGLDLQKALDDPEYAELLAKAHRQHLEAEARSREIDEQMRQNLPLSLEAIAKKAEEMGVDEATRDECVTSMWQLGEEMVKGVLPTGFFELLIRGREYEQRVEEAYEAGRREGLDIRIDEHLREARQAPVEVRPTQMAVGVGRSKPQAKNPFVDADW